MSLWESTARDSKEQGPGICIPIKHMQESLMQVIYRTSLETLTIYRSDSGCVD